MRITPRTALLCCVEFDYSEGTKNIIKALPGVSYVGGSWLVPILHLPLLKATFDAMNVDPAVVAAYHALLCRMMDDLSTSMHRKGALGKHIAELMERHANGIARIVQNGYKTPERTKTARTTTNAPTSESSAVSASHGLELIIAGTRNAHANLEKQDNMRRRRRW